MDFVNTFFFKFVVKLRKKEEVAGVGLNILHSPQHKIKA